jgi:hypothetical protein
LKLLMSPVMLPKVKLRSSTLELFGRVVLPAFPWSTYVCLWSVIAIDGFLIPKLAYLGDEYGEGDVVNLHVGPGDVAHETLTADP